MSAITDLYDFETILPNAVKTVLQDQFDLVAFTLADKIDFQKDRPRVEIIYQHQGETNPKRIAMLPDGSKRTSCFRGELKLIAISEAEETGKLAHSQYRAQVRNACSQLEQLVNETQLDKHRINFTVTGHEVTGVRQQDGYQQTTFPFIIDISIQQDAWATVL